MKRFCTILTENDSNFFTSYMKNNIVFLLPRSEYSHQRKTAPRRKALKYYKTYMYGLGFGIPRRHFGHNYVDWYSEEWQHSNKSKLFKYLKHHGVIA